MCRWMSAQPESIRKFIVYQLLCDVFQSPIFRWHLCPKLFFFLFHIMYFVLQFPIFSFLHYAFFYCIPFRSCIFPFIQLVFPFKIMLQILYFSFDPIDLPLQDIVQYRHFLADSLQYLSPCRCFWYFHSSLATHFETL